VAAYLAQGPLPWQPADVDADALAADFTVAADGSGSHRTVQAAVDTVPAADTIAPGRRWVIRIRPGIYRGPLCVQGKPPLALVGAAGGVDAVVLIDQRHAGLPKPAGTPAQPCLPNLAAERHGTSGSATAIIASPDVLLAHLTIANDATGAFSRPARLPAAATGEGAQAVALLTSADRVQLDNIRLVSHQDTFYVRRPAPGAPARVFMRASLVEGDVDFVFGNATLVIDDSTLQSRADRQRAGHVLAPSTPAAQALGMLVQRSRFIAEPGLAPGGTSLGRAWDEGVAPGTWQHGVSPNGQALVRDSALGPHIGGWAASTARRPFRPPAADGTVQPEANRLAESGNHPAPAHTAREAAPFGWATAGGGTRGGADAAAADVHTVRTRAELLAALALHPRPRIVQVQGRIDLATDAAGRPLGAADFQAPGFSWAAYATAYAPAVWGQRPPAGPLEDARRASAAAQAAHIIVRVPARTTLIGLGRDATLTGGSLLLDGVSDVIVRNLHLQHAFDHFPAWDPADNGHGEWNAEHDTLALRRASRVWIDHCTFDRLAPGTPPPAVLLGRPMQHTDGLLDITRASTHVTVSWSHLRQADKTALIGGSDRHSDDEGRLQITLHHNLWQATSERSPRVRYGQVHLANNLHLVPDAAAFGYAIGLGHQASVLSRHNAWLTPPGVPAQRLLRRLGTARAFDEQGSLRNGAPLSRAAMLASFIDGATLPATVDWQPPAPPPLDAAADVPARVRASAGAGKLVVLPLPPR
jgi:pectate lyase/pectin methylesterase-like acyl-CoA thioesterase